MTTIAKLCGGNAFYARHRLEDCLSIQSRMGTKHMELWPLAPHLWVDGHGHQDVQGLGERLKALGIRPICLMPSLYQYSLCAEPASLQQKATANYYENCLKAASALDITCFCVDARGGCKDVGKEKLLAYFIGAIDKLVDRATQYGITLLVQNAPPWETQICNTLAELKEVLGASGGHIKAALNTAAMYDAGETVPIWFAAIGGQIGHVRLLDGRNDGYRIWGRGVYPLSHTLCELSSAGYRGYLGTQAYTERYDFIAAKADLANRHRLAEAIESR